MKAVGGCKAGGRCASVCVGVWGEVERRRLGELEMEGMKDRRANGGAAS